MNLSSWLAVHFDKKSENLFLQRALDATSFENSYLDVREKEGRLLSDDVVRRLPEYIGVHQNEWRKRRRSARRFVRYVSNYNDANILEIGCGNGWFSHQVAKSNPRINVVGSDINATEVYQGARVFAGQTNLKLVAADIFTAEHAQPLFDIIVFASSLQYFQHLNDILGQCAGLLHENGEVHILDTPLYAADQLAEAKLRSREYFQKLNSQMAGYYFHHSIDELERFYPVKLYSPGFVSRALGDSPFPWIKISRKNLLSSEYSKPLSNT